jgi:hypothetical protein
MGNPINGVEMTEDKDFKIIIERLNTPSYREKRRNYNMSVPESIGDKLMILMNQANYNSVAGFLGAIIEKIVDDIEIVDPMEIKNDTERSL